MIVAYPVAGKQKSVNLCAAFQHGAPPEARGAVFYGVNRMNIDAWKKIVRRGEDWFYLDNSFFDKTRGSYFRVAKNSFQIKALDHVSDGARFAALGIEVQPWKGDRLGYVLAVEQSKTFMQDIARDEHWLTVRMQRARENGKKVKLRRWSAAKPDIAKTLAADIEGATIVLTHSSAAAVEALLAGVEVHVSSMSAVSGVTPEGRRWAAFNTLADAQFTVNEIRNGEAWKWLNKDR